MLRCCVRRAIDAVRRVLFGLRFRLLVLVLAVCAPIVGVTIHTTLEGRQREVADWREHARQLTQVVLREDQEVDPALIGQLAEDVLGLGAAAVVDAVRISALRPDQMAGAAPAGILGANFARPKWDKCATARTDRVVLSVVGIVPAEIAGVLVLILVS